MRRPVIVWVDDEQVDEINVVGWQDRSEVGEPDAAVTDKWCTVPRDDQLTRDVDMVTRFMLDHCLQPDETEYEACDRLRAAFQLDQEDS